MQHFVVESELYGARPVVAGARSFPADPEVGYPEAAIPNLLSDLVALRCAKGYEIPYHIVCYLLGVLHFLFFILLILILIILCSWLWWLLSFFSSLSFVVYLLVKKLNE